MAERRPLVIVSGAVQELPSGDSLPGATPGADGKTILYGTAAPTTEGVDGDFYIRTTTNFIYGPKAGGTWPAGVSLVGPQGPAGADGVDGADGADAPNRSAVTAAPSSSGTLTLDYTDGDYFTTTLTENVTTLTISNMPGSGTGVTLALKITQDSTPRTFAWPASFKWVGSAPSISTGSGDVDLLIITSFDNGTTWQADLAKDYA